MRRDILYTILAAAVLSLTVIPVGAAVFVLGFVNGDSPCVMCWQERTAMVLIALIGLFVLRHGPKPKYLGLSILVGAWGIHMALRHTAMHAARDVGQGFSIEILGAHTYTWALFIFLACIVTMGALLLATREGDFVTEPRKLRPLEKLAMWVFLLVTAGNIFQAFASTGPPPFMGQGDPVRFSFNPRHWVWSLEEYEPAPVSLRGRWAIEKPDVALLSGDPAAGPIAGLPVLPVREQKRIDLPLRGTATDLAYDAHEDRFLLTTQNGIYITDGSLTRVLRHTVVDPGYSVDLGRFAGAAFLDAGQVMALSENKSYVILRPDDQADAAQNFRYFLESFDKFVELSRARFSTVRSRMMYVMSLAYDPAGNSLYTISVPNSKIRRLVVSRFDRRDLTLSEEFVLRPASDSGLKFAGEKRSLDELYVTGATVADGRMYAISAACNTLLTIDLATRAAVAAHTVPDLVRPTGIAVRNGDLYIIGEGGLLSIVPSP